jgi:hypothetical protein
MMKTPLHLVAIPCSVCKDLSNLLDVNMGHENLHNEQGASCRFPKDGLDEEQLVKVRAIHWMCEVCHEEAHEYD